MKDEEDKNTKANWMRIDEIRLRTMDYRDTRLLLETLSSLKNTEVGFIIDDLNDKYGTTFRYNDYLRNRELPMELRNACRSMHQTLGAEQEKVVDECIKTSKGVIPFMARAFLFLMAIIMILTWLRNIFS
jgi:hypothetical protein